MRRAVSYAGLTLAAAAFLLPLIFMVTGSLKRDDAVLSDGNSARALLPTPWEPNYADAFERVGFGQLFLNSVIIVVPIVLGSLLVNSLAGYALARLRFGGQRIVLAAVIALAVIPFQGIAIPLMLMMSRLSWLDTYHVQILPFVASPFFIYLFYTFFLGLPKELEEAARLDGAGPWRLFAQIVVPNAKPAFATVAILSFLLAWGELLWPVLATRGPDVRPLPLGMAEFQNDPPIQWGDIMAYAAMFTAPLLVMFVVFQRAFVRGVAFTGLRG